MDLFVTALGTILMVLSALCVYFFMPATVFLLGLSAAPSTVLRSCHRLKNSNKSLPLSSSCKEVVSHQPGRPLQAAVLTEYMMEGQNCLSIIYLAATTSHSSHFTLSCLQSDSGLPTIREVCLEVSLLPSMLVELAVVTLCSYHSSGLGCTAQGS